MTDTTDQEKNDQDIQEQEQTPSEQAQIEESAGTEGGAGDAQLEKRNICDCIRR